MNERQTILVQMVANVLDSVPEFYHADIIVYSDDDAVWITFSRLGSNGLFTLGERWYEPEDTKEEIKYWMEGLRDV